MNRATGKGLSALMEACVSVEKPNSTVGPIILAAVIDMAPRRLAPVSAAAAAAATATAAAAAAAPAPRTWASVAAAGLPPDGAQFPKIKPARDCERTMVTEEGASAVELLDHECESSKYGGDCWSWSRPLAPIGAGGLREELCRSLTGTVDASGLVAVFHATLRSFFSLFVYVLSRDHDHLKAKCEWRGGYPTRDVRTSDTSRVVLQMCYPTHYLALEATLTRAISAPFPC